MFTLHASAATWAWRLSSMPRLSMRTHLLSTSHHASSSPLLAAGSLTAAWRTSCCSTRPWTHSRCLAHLIRLHCWWLRAARVTHAMLHGLSWELHVMASPRRTDEWPPFQPSRWPASTTPTKPITAAASVGKAVLRCAHAASVPVVHWCTAHHLSTERLIETPSSGPRLTPVSFADGAPLVSSAAGPGADPALVAAAGMDPSSGHSSGGLSGGEIAGIVLASIGGAMALATLLALAVVGYRKRRQG